MRNRLCIIILLMAWIGQWAISTGGPLATQGAPGWEGCLRVENLAYLVTCQARGRWFWPTSRSYPHGRGQRAKRRRRQSGRGRWRVVVTPAEASAAKASFDGTQTSPAETVFAASRWGVAPEMSQALPERLYTFWQRYAACFKTQTRDTSVYAYHYLSGLLRLETDRHYTNIGRATGVAGENVQHFMSNSPWPAGVAVHQARQEIRATPGVEPGSILLLDESSDEAGEKMAGAGRKYNGRLGKVELSVTGVFVGYANLTDATRPLWTWVDGELYLPEHWFTPQMAKVRKQVGLPPERRFETKIELGWKMIQRAQAQGLPFDGVAFDDGYGRSAWLRDQVAGAGIIYMADVPSTTQVYLEKPILGIPERRPSQRGPDPTRLRVLNGVRGFKAYQVAQHADTHLQRVPVRTIERGVLNDPFAARPVWTLRQDDPEPVREWLVMRREGKRTTYSLCNAPPDADLAYLVWFKCQRYFVERANQDAKSEVGWDELRARKYRAWEHHLALVILAVWFLAQTRWEWAEQYARDPALVQQFDLDVLPALSLANIRVLLRAAMPLPQPTPDEAVALVVEHLVNRSRSRKSRLKHQRATSNHANAPP